MHQDARPAPDIGLALSGGGSRAAAFHRGTLRALLELGVVPRIKAVSAVSGGSVFAAAWMAARARGLDDAAFLAWIREKLSTGFIRPTLLNWRVIKWLWRSRTELLAETFDRLLFDGLSFGDLPKEPLLCLNTTVMNNATGGRFSQQGYSCAGVGQLVDDKHYPIATITGLTLGFATAASAAFPFGLPPLRVSRRRIDLELVGLLQGHDELILTDGGILENLGIERLVQSDTFHTDHVIVSDAGLRDQSWRPSFVGRLKSAAIFALSPQTLDRLLLIMNDKQNRSMRQLLFERLFGDAAAHAGRHAIFIRLETDLTRLLQGLPKARLDALGVTDHDSADTIALALERSGVDLSRALSLYKDLGDTGAAAANQVSTSFTGLGADELDRLEHHAEWQVHAMFALFGRALVPS